MVPSPPSVHMLESPNTINQRSYRIQYPPKFRVLYSQMSRNKSFYGLQYTELPIQSRKVWPRRLTVQYFMALRLDGQFHCHEGRRLPLLNILI